MVTIESHTLERADEIYDSGDRATIAMIRKHYSSRRHSEYVNLCIRDELSRQVAQEVVSHYVETPMIIELPSEPSSSYNGLQECQNP